MYTVACTYDAKGSKSLCTAGASLCITVSCILVNAENHLETNFMPAHSILACQLGSSSRLEVNSSNELKQIGTVLWNCKLCHWVFW